MTRISYPTASKLDERIQWLNARRFEPSGGFRVTASDAAAILGWHPSRTGLKVYETKITGVEQEDTPEMKWGRYQEPVIALWYADETGRRVENPGATTITVHPDLPWLAATLDRVIWDYGDEDSSGAPLEIKHAGDYNLREWLDGAPLWVQMQLQIQMACWDAGWGAYCGSVGGQPPKYGDVDRNDTFIDSAIRKLEEFVQQCNRRTPPPPTLPRDLDVIRNLYPLDNGDTVHLDKSHEKLADQWEQAKSDRKKAEDEAKTTEAKIRAAIGAATFATLPDGTLLTLTTTVRKDGVRYRTLRRKAS